ncbi:MAG TPA: cell division protein FtsZ, partial [Methylibium sp.]
MSSLQVSLAVLGGLVLAGIVAHSAWQARRAGVRTAPQSAARQEPREPVLGDGATPPAAPQMAGETEPAATLGQERLDLPPLLRRSTARLDALIDAIASLTLEAPVSAETALLHLPPSRRAGSKPFMIEGLNTESGDWELPALGQRYGEFQAGVQLANRTGALNEIEYSEFVQKVQAFAEAVGAMADFPDMLDVVARARELDAFAGDHDAQLAVHLRSKAVAWSVGYIQQHAGWHGFVAGVVPGRLVLPSAEEGAPPVLTLTFDSQAALADDPGRAAVRDV